jgi:UDP-glucose 4-epimerase
MKVLVCGGAGYIGAHMCKRLAAHGHAVAVFDDLSTGHLQAVRWGPLFRGDLAGPASVRDALNQFRPDGVMHFAARSLVAESVRDPAAYYAGNVLASLNLLDRLREYGPCPLIFSSTAAVYGVPRTGRLTETEPLRPINAYGRTKLAVEMALADYWSAYRLPSVALRYFNAAGADTDAELGEAHITETHLIPLILEAAAGRGSAITVFGDDYDTPDGTCIRDYVHVEDLCDAHLLALEWLGREPGAHALNLGNGAGFSVRTVIDTASRILGTPVAYAIGSRRAGDPPRLVADASAARATLGWTPQQPQLEAMIASAWAWHRARKF